MNTATIVLSLLAAGLLVYAWRRGDGTHRRGVVLGLQTFRQTLPMLLVAFVIVGYVEVLSPQSLVQAWIGPGSGLRGLILAEGAGMLLPGGPYVVFPLMAALYRAGAGLGPAVTLVTAWAMQALLTISFELPFMGWRFTAVRWSLGMAFPLLAGLAVQVVTGAGL